MSKEIVPWDINIYVESTKSPNTWWLTKVSVAVPDIEGHSWESDASELAIRILESTHWEWLSKLVQSWSNITLSLELKPEVLLELMRTHAWYEEAIKKPVELRSENDALQAEVRKLQEQVEVLQNWELYMLSKFSTPITTYASRKIDNMNDFIKFIKSKSICTLWSILSDSYRNTKKDALTFLWELFKIWKFPDEMRIVSSWKFNYPKPGQMEKWSHNDMMRDRITTKTLSEYDWESLSELCGNSTSKKFYEFALTCFFAWVKLKP